MCLCHSSLAPWGFSSRVHSVRSGRPRRKVAEWSPLSGLSEHTQAHFWLPTPTDLWPVSLMYFTLLSRHTDNFIQAKNNNNNNNNNQGHTCDRAGGSVLRSVCPQPTLSRYYVNRDTLFCYHKASEAFLQRLMALYVASHYKVTLFYTLNNSIFLKRAQCPTHSVVFPPVCSFVDSMFSRDPEFTKRPADVVRCSGPSPLLPPATGAPHTELATWGPRCGPGKTWWNSALCNFVQMCPNNFIRKNDFTKAAIPLLSVI